jgi:hypothetical protein
MTGLSYLVISVPHTYPSKLFGYQRPAHTRPNTVSLLSQSQLLADDLVHYLVGSATNGKEP